MLSEVNELETEVLMVSSIMKKFMLTCVKDESDQYLSSLLAPINVYAQLRRRVT